MMARLIVVVCACGFQGRLPTGAKCVSCGASPARRVTKERAVVLSRIATFGSAVLMRIEPMMRIWLVDQGLVRDLGARPGRSTASFGHSPSARMFELTPDGVNIERIARDAYDTTRTRRA